MGKYKFFIPFLILLSGLILQNCSLAEPLTEPFSPEEEVIFCLPEWPFLEPSLAGWQISLYGEQKDSFWCNAEERYITVKTPKNRILGILARPVTLGSNGKTETLFFFPAGSLYPHLAEAGSSVMNLTWEDGFTVSAMKTLEKSGTFNWKHFSQIIRNRSGEELYNPWTLNMKNLSEKIISGNFNASSLNQKKPSYVDLSRINRNSLVFPYIPLNRKEIPPKSVPLWLTETSYQNLFLTDADHMLLIKGTDIKKLSEDIVFLPKKYEETVYAKKNDNTEHFIDDCTFCKLR